MLGLEVHINLGFGVNNTVRLSDTTRSFGRVEDIEVNSTGPDACVTNASFMEHLGRRIGGTGGEQTPEDGQ